MSDKACSTRRLLSSPQMAVDHCPHCGTFHLHVGPVSMRLDRNTFDHLVDGLAVARSTVRPEHGLVGHAPIAEA